MLHVDDEAIVLRGAIVAGDVAVGARSSIWYNAVARGDCNSIRIGHDTNIQDNCVVHVGYDRPTIIGNGVTVGHAAIIHGCTIEDNVLIGMGSIVMDGAHVGCDCIVGAGSLVTQNTVIPSGMLALGRPAKPVRELSAQEIEGIRKSAADYVQEARLARDMVGEDVFRQGGNE